MSGHAGGAPERPAGEDPSMEDILASIRRILSEDEAVAAPPADLEAAVATPESPAPPARRQDVLALDESMLVREPEPESMESPTMPAGDVPPHRPEQEQRVAFPPEPTPPLSLAQGLVAPEAAAATAASMGALLRTLTGGRPQPLQVTRAGTTLEDIVRDELRPIVKAWLDDNLPALVERLVRAEIERVVGRATDL